MVILVSIGHRLGRQDDTHVIVQEAVKANKLGAKLPLHLGELLLPVSAKSCGRVRTSDAATCKQRVATTERNDRG
jgi:hypothetical protein